MIRRLLMKDAIKILLFVIMATVAIGFGYVYVSAEEETTEQPTTEAVKNGFYIKPETNCPIKFVFKESTSIPHS